VAAGRPAELARQGGIEVETGDGVRHFATATRDDVPRIIAELVASGERIYGVRVLRGDLEDIYLDAVEGEQR
jgi:ABC-2 type transport system ATP-binding protein